MGENIISLKSVRELLGLNFFIPNYQRGYRWTSQQVGDLLDDIKDFKSNNPQTYQFYCVQPLVVRKMSDTEVHEKNLGEDLWYEVIDGQQRLTTIYLILKVLQKFFPLAFSEIQLYTMKYQRNNKIEAFFQSSEDASDENNSDIDLHHISNAYTKIYSWLKKYWDCGIMDTLIQWNIDEKGRDKANNVRFIWYESVDENPIKVFTRLNIGKISLTNAELIKAMILNRYNFIKQDISDITLRQQEIASEWDTIEYQLQKDEFWLFLNKPGYQNPTRIDYIFNLMCDNNVLVLDVDVLQSIGDDKDRTFRYFYEYFKLPNSDVVTCWKKVKKYFNTFKEWYDDVHLYHYIGFLVSQGYDAHALSKEWDRATTKTSFVNGLKQQIKNIVTKYPLSHQYNVEDDNKRLCLPILLFHNIQSVINRNVIQKENDKYKLAVFYKFPFHLYKLEGWDVEHINSNITNPEDDSNTREEWLTNIYLSVSSESQKKIEEFFSTATSEERKDTLYSDIKSSIPLMDNWTPETKNQIWNYTLLDSSTNRGYGNAIFSAKRRIIIGKDKGELLKIPKITADGLVMIDANKGKSSFVPPCTKNVFLKCYSPSVSENNYWTISDAEYYREDIAHCIQQLNKPETLEK
jgi:Uncharacterized conserved protein